jgi:surface protein
MNASKPYPSKNNAVTSTANRNTSTNTSRDAPGVHADGAKGSFTTAASSTTTTTTETPPEGKERRMVKTTTVNMEIPHDLEDGQKRETGDPEKVTLLPPVPEMPQSQRNTKQEYLAEADIVLEPDLVIGESPEEPKAFWRQRKVQRGAIFLSLLAIGVVVGVVVGVGSNSGRSEFDCSDTSVGCLYTGSMSVFRFQDPETSLLVNCMDPKFEFPTSDNCTCEVTVPISNSGNSDSCQSCSFVDAAKGWGLAYDCSNIWTGDCVGLEPNGVDCISKKGKCFETTSELQDAVDIYLADSSARTLVASTYGWPIGTWCVSEIQDFSYLFNANDFIISDGGERFNPAAANFSENISGWDVSSATAMQYMFRGASYFNQPLAEWDVSTVTDMHLMFDGALSFDQPIGTWNVSSVKDMRFMFVDAYAFNQPLADWDVSSVTDMYSMFYSAEAFNQPLADWDVSSVTEMYSMFSYATAFDQPIGNWDVSSVTTLSNMFSFAESFDQPLGNWDVSSVKDMSYMFWRASSFNQPLADWEVLFVKDMSHMFEAATSFNQPLGTWNGGLTNRKRIFYGSGCPFIEGEESCFYV